MRTDSMMIKNKLEEYKMLRSEILYYMNKDTMLFTCLFTSVTAILFFSFEWKIQEGCLLSFLVIIPIGSKFAYHQKQMAKISEYMQHYLEPDIGIMWETFLTKLSDHSDKPKTARYMKFSECLMMAIGAVISFFYLVLKKGIEWKNNWNLVMEIVVLAVLFMWTVYISKKIYMIKDYKILYKRVMNNIHI